MNKCQVLPVVTFTSIVSITSSEYFDKGQVGSFMYVSYFQIILDHC